MVNNIEELLKQLTEELIDYINDKKYVYKTCGDYIVVLEKLPDTLTNENRSNVSQIGDNKLYAKYRADVLLVKKIINKYDLTQCETVMSSYEIETIYEIKNKNKYEIETKYEINKNVYPDKFDNNLEKVCSSGIHYFLNLKCAFHYCINLEIINGEYLKWYDNGQMCIKCNYIDGNLNGEYIQWHENGQMWIKYNYINGELNGDYLSWYENGQMREECNYVNGKRKWCNGCLMFKYVLKK